MVSLCIRPLMSTGSFVFLIFDEAVALRSYRGVFKLREGGFSLDEKTYNADCLDTGASFDLHYISRAQLANLGMDEIAFVKPVATDGGTTFSIHAADGTPMAIATDALLAAASIIQHDMVPSLVH